MMDTYRQLLSAFNLNKYICLVVFFTDKDAASKFLKKAIGFFNVFTVLQVSWMIELYYLGLNSVIHFFEFLINHNATGFNIPISPLIIEYNTIVLKYFSDYSMTVIIICIALFVCAFSFSFVKYIPILSDYNLLLQYVDYGFYCSGWLFLIWFTYKLFCINFAIYLLAPPIISLLAWASKKGIAKLEDKLPF